jgi:hypothetical protein
VAEGSWLSNGVGKGRLLWGSVRVCGSYSGEVELACQGSDLGQFYGFRIGFWRGWFGRFPRSLGGVYALHELADGLGLLSKQIGSLDRFYGGQFFGSHKGVFLG